MAEKLSRMAADTFEARSRLGLGFAGPVHIHGSLKIMDSRITHLCDTLCVDGSLDLTGCINLAELPPRLIVRNKLTIDGCSKITTLPASVQDINGLSASGCSQLTSISPLTTCHGTMDLTGCSSMAPLPTDFRLRYSLTLDKCRFGTNSIVVETEGLPDTVLEAIIGRPISDIITPPLLVGHPVLKARIEKAEEMEGWSAIRFVADTSALINSDRDYDHDDLPY